MPQPVREYRNYFLSVQYSLTRSCARTTRSVALRKVGRLVHLILAMIMVTEVVQSDEEATRTRKELNSLLRQVQTNTQKLEELIAVVRGLELAKGGAGEENGTKVRLAN